MLSQAEADALIGMEKQIVVPEISFPAPGDTLTVPVVSVDERESF